MRVPVMKGYLFGGKKDDDLSDLFRVTDTLGGYAGK
jgi:hypothetical protein